MRISALLRKSPIVISFFILQTVIPMGELIKAGKAAKDEAVKAEAADKGIEEPDTIHGDAPAEDAAEDSGEESPAPAGRKNTGQPMSRAEWEARFRASLAGSSAREIGDMLLVITDVIEKSGATPRVNAYMESRAPVGKLPVTLPTGEKLLKKVDAEVPAAEVRPRLNAATDNVSLLTGSVPLLFPERQHADGTPDWSELGVA